MHEGPTENRLGELGPSINIIIIITIIIIIKTVPRSLHGQNSRPG